MQSEMPQLQSCLEELQMACQRMGRRVRRVSGLRMEIGEKSQCYWTIFMRAMADLRNPQTHQKMHWEVQSLGGQYAGATGTSHRGSSGLSCWLRGHRRPPSPQ